VSEDRDQSFPLKLGALWRAVWFGTLVGVFLTASIDLMRGEPFSFRTTAGVVAGAVVACLFMYFVVCTRANSKRLLIANSLGTRRNLPWGDIVEVTYTKRWGYPQWRLTSASGKHHWLARDTKNLSKLYQLAREHGGENHPLVRALEKPIYEHE
jgi:hypothetical protein